MTSDATAAGRKRRSGRLHEVVRVFGLIALVAGDQLLYADIRRSLATLEASGEQERSYAEVD